ncbi:MAG: hypothetical protein ACOCUR_01005 [Nanoarchaeota archaeon]
MRDTVYDRYLKFQDLLKDEFPKLGDTKFFKMLGKLESWHYPSKRWKDMALSKEEAKIYEWRVNKGYNPSTVYKWYRILGENKEIHAKVKNNAMSLQEAKTYPKPFRRLTELESELMYHIKQSISRYLVR